MFWLKNQRYDLIFFTLPMLIVLCLYPLEFASHQFIQVVGLASLALSAIHIGANWTLLYRDASFIGFDKFRYLYMGVFIIIGSTLVSLWNLNLFMSIYVYWGLWHFARQHWGIGMLYKTKSGFFEKTDYKADKILIHLLLFLPLFIQFSREGKFGFYTIELYRFYLNKSLSNDLLIIYFLCLIIWLFYSWYRYMKRKLVIPSFLVFFASILSFACIYFFVDNFLLMYTMISIPHSLQYIGLTVHYHEGKNKNILNWNSKKEYQFRVYYCGFLLVYVLAAVFFVKLNEQLHSPLIYGLLSLTIFHFWVELFSWKPKFNPELKQSLSIGINNKQS